MGLGTAARDVIIAIGVSRKERRRKCVVDCRVAKGWGTK